MSDYSKKIIGVPSQQPKHRQAHIVEILHNHLNSENDLERLFCARENYRWVAKTMEIALTLDRPF